METKELIQALRSDAEWAHANEWETPIMLSDHLDAAADALAAYEDTGITPEEIDHAKDLLAAERDGRLVALPCKEGDTVYIISGLDAECDPKIEEKTIYSFDVGKDGRVLLRSDTFDGTICYADELGKITDSPFREGYYLTRTEAEKALGKEAQS